MAVTVIALCGLPGSGKSSLAHAIEKSTGWHRLDRDALRGELFVAGGYSVADKQRLSNVLRERMCNALIASQSVIIDGMTFSRNEEREAFREAALSHGANWLLVWLDCPLAVARERVRNDVWHAAADRDVTLVDIVAARFEAPAPALVLDATRAASELHDAVLRALPGVNG